MSLLLEALKKAEKAKEEAQRAAKDGETAGGDGLSLVDADGHHVRTRDELPDITRPMNIQTADLDREETSRSSAVAPRAPAPSRDAPAGFKPEPRSAAASMSDDPAAPERATARKVFEAKFKEPNPRLPFYITMGLLGAFAVGTVGYFWYQLKPPTALVNTNPPRGADVQTAEAAPPSAATSPSAPATASGPPAAAPLPGLPGSQSPPPPVAATSPAPSPAPAPAAANAPAASGPAPAAKPAAPAPNAAGPSAVPTAATPGTPAARRAPRPAAPSDGNQSASAQPNAALAVNRNAPAIDARIEGAYADYQAGRFEAARTGYAQVLRDEPSHRDALLGLGAIETRTQRYEVAESYYQRVLRLDPRDSHAHAALLALRGGQMDPVLAESRLKSLLAGDPDASVLQASLGNQYAQQGRWAEAQQAYFKAFAAEPDNPDYAYNLAVSLDHLRQTKPAGEYYRRALALAEKRNASFDRAMAQTRAQALAR